VNAMERVDVRAATQVADEDVDDITIPEIGDALSTIAVKLDQFGHTNIADELRVLGAHLAGSAIRSEVDRKGPWH
jgi:hypothetical protein